MDKIIFKQKVFRNIIWKLLERSSAFAITMIINVILARILDPSDFGLLTMVTVFVSFSTIFVTGGVGSALIQIKGSGTLDFSSGFWLNLIMSLILYGIIFFSAPIISEFYGYAQLSAMLRILGLTLFVSAINTIQCAYISKNMMFKYYFYSTLSGKVISGVLAVIMALCGTGVWALIFQVLSMILFETIILWVKVKWRPSFIFSYERVKKIYSFSWKIMIVSLVASVRDQLTNMLIGKKYSSEALAYYNKGALFPSNIVTNLTTALSAVMFPVLSSLQDSKEQVLRILRQWVRVFAYSVFPILMGLVVTAKSLTVVLLTEKWLPSIPFLLYACATYAAWVIEAPIRETLKSLGYANICMKMQIIKTIFVLAVLGLVMNYGVDIIAASAAVCAIFNIAVSMFYGNKYAGYAPVLLAADVLPTMLTTLLMGVLVYLVGLAKLPVVLVLVLQIFTGIITYIFFSVLFKNKSFFYCLTLLRDVIKKK